MSMANRIIRSGFLDSEKINSLTDPEQLFFVRLMLVADDYGHCDGRHTWIRSNCYPVTEVSVEKVGRMVENLAEKGLVKLYTVDGKPYLEILKFGQRLRSMRYRFPRPTDDGHVTDNRPPESESEVESESEKKRIEYSPSFLSFWEQYPKKVGKGSAWKEWKKENPPLEECLKTLAWQKVSLDWTKEGGKYIVAPERWIKGRRWEDEYVSPIKPEPVYASPEEQHAAAALALQRRNTRAILGGV